MNVKLAHRQGMSIRAIARSTGLSRQTVRKILAQPVPSRYGPRPPRPSKLEPFADYLTEQLDARPWVRASRLYTELCERGYSGCYDLVKRWVRDRRRADAAHRRAHVRFETAPGVEAQFDWKGHLTGIIDADPALKVWIFRLVLAYSRRRFTFATTSQSLPVVLSDLQLAFTAAGGLAHRLVFDNIKAAVLVPRPHLVLHPLFADFCRHYGVEPAPALVYSPERKGKVERSFLDLVDSELLERTYPSLEALQLALSADDLRHADRIHTTTSARPAERLERERPFLLPLPEVAFDCRQPETRRVLSDCTVSYRAAYYSVPHRLVGQTVTVKADPRRPQIEIFAGADLVASHHLVARGERVIVDEHIAELRRPRWERARARRPVATPVPSAPDVAQMVRWPATPVPLRPIEDYAAAVEVLA